MTDYIFEYKKKLKSKNLIYKLFQLDNDFTKQFYNFLNKQTDKDIELFGGKMTYDEVVKYFTEIKANNGFSYQIIHDDIIIGYITLSYRKKYYLPKFNNNYWLNIFIDHAHSGYNYGIEASRTIIDYVDFYVPHITDIYIGVYDDNVRSIKVWLKLNFDYITQTKNGSHILVYRML